MTEIHMERNEKLFTPGPVNIPERVYAAAMLGSFHHRTPAFREVMKETIEGLRPLFGTSSDILPVHTTGRGAMEGIFNSVFNKEKDRIVCVVNGKFGEMAASAMKKVGFTCLEVFKGWDTAVDLKELERVMVDFNATALVSVFNDTSNGVVNPVWDMGKLSRKLDALFVVDNVSALGCMPFRMDEWSIDAVATASQKGLMSPVGLSFVAANDRAMRAAEANPHRDFYVDLVDIKKSLASKGETPGSTPVSIVMSVHEALNMMKEEGLENVFRRHHAISLGTKAALASLGFELYPHECEFRSDSLTVATVPDGMSAKKLVSTVCTEFKLRMGAGLNETADRLVRIAHMGYCYAEDYLQLFSAIECTMEDMGFASCMGKGTGAFIRAYREALKGE